MVGVELRQRAMPVVQALMNRGVLALTAGPTVLRLLPPLVIAPADITAVLTAVGEALADVSGAGDAGRSGGSLERQA
jgi:acetylornithine/LysW-gamma-L-lysine aminotransferase